MQVDNINYSKLVNKGCTVAIYNKFFRVNPININCRKRTFNIILKL